MHAPAVVLVDEDSASGMAEMLASLLESNLGDFRSRRAVARMVRGDVVFTASDRDMSVTVSFGPEVVKVRDGRAPDAPVVGAPWLTMARVCSGTASPLDAWRRGGMRVEGLRRSPMAGAAAWVLSVPSSFYEQEVTLERDRRLALTIIATVLVVATLVVVASRRHRKLSLP